MSRDSVLTSNTHQEHPVLRRNLTLLGWL